MEWSTKHQPKNRHRLSPSIEWSERNKYNSMNSYKGLTYYQNYKAVMKWMQDGKYLPPPVECNLDPMAECNLDCYFCITQRYLKHNREEVGEMRQLPTDYMLNLVDFLAKWGVRGLCISGGGEPTLHKGLPQVIDRARKHWIDVALVTNATHFSTELICSIMGCRWVALSVDAGTPETYYQVKGKDLFNQVKDNIRELTDRRKQYIKHRGLTDFCYKFLLLPENQHEIFDACRLARDLGIQDFHARPVDFEREDIKGHKKLEFDYELIFDQFAKCHELETDSFHVYTVTHKFDPEFHVNHDFKECLATPLVIPILQDGNAYLCVDKKMEAQYKLGSCYPDPESILDWWGSDAHRELIKSVDINTCSRCTWGVYNRQIEETVLKDGMCLSFP